MCIRDRLETLGSSLPQVTARYVEVDGKPYVMEMILPLAASARSTLNSTELIYRDAPVSYTHLAQRGEVEADECGGNDGVHACVGIGNIDAGDLAEDAQHPGDKNAVQDAALDPVSYTHLDVYKRQSPVWSFAAMRTHWPL